MGALPRVCQSQCRRKCVPRQQQPLSLGGTAMVSQNSVCGQEGLFRATAFGRPGVVIVARTCESKFVSTSSLLFAGKQISSLGKRSGERSLWLCVVRLTTLPCDFSHRRESRGRRRYRKNSMGGKKKVSKRSFDTCQCRVVFPGTHHMRDRRITEMSVIVLGQPKNKTILCKRPSPAER